MYMTYTLDEFAEPTDSSFSYGERELVIDVIIGRKEEVCTTIEQLRKEWHSIEDVGDVCLDEYIRAGLHRFGLLNPNPARFYDLLPTHIGAWLDAYFAKEGWERQEFEDGYQDYFGAGVQVDNQYEYGFSHLVTRDDLLAFAVDFYNRNYPASI